MAAESESSSPYVEPIPIYRVDLARPPSERYEQMAKDFSFIMEDITPLFDEVLGFIIPWAWLRRVVGVLASIFLRRVYSAEETSELRGIQKASGVPMYMLIALNVLLDSLLGCTSGGVMISPRNQKRNKGVPDGKLMHFRTLDWGMDSLRRLLVILEFVDSKSKEPDKVIATTITYAGFVGVLTGVRYELSVSLNFRPTHNCSTFSLRLHQMLVLFGFRPSVSSILRSTLVPTSSRPPIEPLNETVKRLETTLTAPCYLIFCNGTKAVVLEKDLRNAKIRESDQFIVQTNHDTPPEGSASHVNGQEKTSSILGMETFLEESEERRDCVQKKWDGTRRRWGRKHGAEKAEEAKAAMPGVREGILENWVKAYPVMNECTHFACIMDPQTATIRFCERGIVRD